MDKVAVDAKAKEYWSAYFKEFGEMWVRDIPRRIKQAIRRDVKASKIEGTLKPIAKDVSTDKTLSIEAAFIGTIDDKDARALITATFDPNGKMQDIDITRVF